MKHVNPTSFVIIQYFYSDYSISFFPQDANDNTPLFAKSVYPVEIYENITSGSVILQLSAQDQDLGVNTGVRYYIVSGNTLGRFFIDSYSGALYVKGPIDRDPPRNENAFLLTVLLGSYV